MKAVGGNPSGVFQDGPRLLHQLPTAKRPLIRVSADQGPFRTGGRYWV